MFHRDCFQILLLNFRSSAETVSLEGSQIDFATETFFLHLEKGGGGGGGGVTENVSQILATINFSSGEIDGKFLPAWKNFIGSINLGQTSRLNLGKFGIGNDIPDRPIGTVRINCRPTRLGQDLILRVCIIGEHILS